MPVIKRLSLGWLPGLLFVLGGMALVAFLINDHITEIISQTGFTPVDRANTDNNEVVHHRLAAYFTSGVLMGMALILSCGYLLKGYRDRHISALFYTGFLFTFILLLQRLPLQPGDIFPSSLAPLSNLLLLFVCGYNLLRLPLNSHNPLLLKLLQALMALLLLNGLASLWIAPPLAMLMATAAYGVTFPLLIGLNGFLAYKKVPRATLLLLRWSLLFTGTLLTILSHQEVLVLLPSPHQPMQVVLIAELWLATLIMLREYNASKLALQKLNQQLEDQQAHNRQLQQEADEAHHELETKIEERTFELEITLRELQETNRQLELQSTIDSLTGVKNRGFFNKRYAAELRVSRRQQTPLAVLMLDIDHFKRVNDSHGHLVGDQTLKQMASLVSSLLKRPTDNICRYGGEEFALLLPNTDTEGAMTLAENIRQAVAGLAIELPHQECLHITASIGVASTIIDPQHPENNLLAAADQALYRAKKAGRNRVINANNSQYSEKPSQPIN